MSPVSPVSPVPSSALTAALRASKTSAVDRWLVIDTATPVAVVGVVDLDGGCVVVDEVLLTETRRHAERLPEVVAGLMEKHGATLLGIGAGVGPGSFIGIRTGLAFAKGLARARSLPLVGISTLAALVVSDEEVRDGAVTAVLDARRGEFYVEEFVVRGSVVEVAGEAVAVKADDERVAAARVFTLSARGLGRVLGQGPRVDERGALVPVYARAPDAKLPSLDPSRGLVGLTLPPLGEDTPR